MKKRLNRQNVILREVNMHNRVLVKDLASTLNVSVDTIRRDITDLHTEKALIQVHGGAVSMAHDRDMNVSPDEVYAFKSKSIIAQKALALVEEGSVILMSGGTTNMELARSLPHDLKATIFTPSITVANLLTSHPLIDLIFVGGKISNQSKISVGGSAMNTLSEISTDICFMGTGYLHSVDGLTDFDWEVVQMKKAMIRASDKLVSLSISEKLESSNRYKICESKQIDTLITELDPLNPLLASYRNQMITVL